MKKSTSTTSQRNLQHSLTKIVLVAIISAGLISVSSYTSIARAGTPPVTVGNTPALLEYENLTPTNGYPPANVLLSVVSVK
jgi:hypothetical protein